MNSRMLSPYPSKPSSCLSPSIEALESRLFLDANLSFPGTHGLVYHAQGEDLTVAYTFTTNSGATVDFFMDVTPYGNGTGTAIPVTRTAENFLSIDTASLAPGRYFLYGLIDDGGVTTSRIWSGVLVLAPVGNPSVSYVQVNTTLGTIVLELYHDKAPVTVANFLTYVNMGFFDDLIFHNVSPADHLIQAGLYAADLTAATPNTPINNEHGRFRPENDLTCEPYTLAMYFSAGSQFIINTADNPSLDAEWYCVFGRVISGFDVVDAIQAVPTSAQDLPGGGALPNVPVAPVTILSVTASVATVLQNNTPVISNAPKPLPWSGDGENMVFTIRNDGAGPMSIGTVILNGSGYIVTQQPAGNLDPTGTTTFTISLAPGEWESRFVEITFTTNGMLSGVFSFALTDNLAPIADSRNLPISSSGTVIETLTSWDDKTPDSERIYVILTQPQFGTVQIVGNTFVYTIDLNYRGSDSFTFAVWDGNPDEFNSLRSEPATITISGGTMYFPNNKGVVTFIDSLGKPGKITFKKSTGCVFINDNGTIGRIFLTDSNDKSTLTIATSGKKAGVILYGVESTGPMAAIKGPYVTLEGVVMPGPGFDAIATISLGAASSAKTAVTLTFSNVVNATIDSNMPIKSLTTKASSATTTSMTLRAPSVKTLSVKGTLQLHAEVTGVFGTIKAANLHNSDLTLNTLKTLAVKGEIRDSSLAAAGAVGTIKSASLLASGVSLQSSLKSLSVKGWVDNSTFAASGTVTTVKIGGSNRSNFGLGVPTDLLSERDDVISGDVRATGTVKSFTVKGVSKQSGNFFVDSLIAAAVVGKASITNWDGLGGLYAPNAATIGKITLKSTTKPDPVYGGFVQIV